MPLTCELSATYLTSRAAERIAARFDRPYVIAAPDEVAPEPASDPEQRQQNVAQQESQRRPYVEMPSGRARERGLCAVPHRRDRGHASQGQPRCRQHIGGRKQRADAARKNFQRVVALERSLSQPRPAQLACPYLARGAVAQRLTERRVDEADAQAQAAHQLGRRSVLGRLRRERPDTARLLDLAAPVKHRLALGEADADAGGGVLPAHLVGVEERALELRPEPLRPAADR